MSLYSPFDLGNNPGPQPWQPPGMLGAFTPFLLQLIGGSDSSGNPFLRMPTFEADVRTVQARMFAQNTVLASRQIRAMEEMAYRNSVNNLIGSGVVGRDSFIGQAAFSAASPVMSMFMQSQDPTYGAMKQGVLGYSAQIMSKVTGGNTFANPAQNAAAIGSLYSAMYNNTWGQDFTKKLGFTYGLTEGEMAPLLTRAAMTGAFSQEMTAAADAKLRHSDEAARLRGDLSSLKQGEGESATDFAQRRRHLQDLIDREEREIKETQGKLDRVVQSTMQSVHRTVSSMKGLFGTTENAAEALEAMFGVDAFGKGEYDEKGNPVNAAAKARANATTLSSQLVSMATRYGMKSEVLGNMMMRTIGNTASAMGFSAEEQQVGFGTGISSWMAANAAFSAGQAANGDPAKMQKFMLGYSQRMSAAGASQNMKLHTMLQYAINKGLVDPGDAGRLRDSLSSGDVGARRAAINELFDSFGGYDEGMRIMNSTNSIAGMEQSFSKEEQRAVANAVTRTMNNEGRMSVENARNRRVSKAARSALRMQGYSGSQIRELETQGSIEGMTAALNALTGDDAANAENILGGAEEAYQNAIAEGKSPAEAQRIKANVMRRLSQSFLSGEGAQQVMSGGNKGAADKLGGEDRKDPERAEISKRIAFAKRQRKVWSKDERQLLRDAEKALRKGDTAHAKSLLEQFFSKTGKRGDLVKNKKFAASTGTKDLKELDAAAAADAAGLGPAAAATLPEGTSTEAPDKDKAGGKDVEAQADDTAAKGEDSGQSGLTNILKRGLKGFLQNPEANGEEFDKSPAGKFLNELGKLLRELYKEIMADNAKDQGSA